MARHSPSAHSSSERCPASSSPRRTPRLPCGLGDFGGGVLIAQHKERCNPRAAAAGASLAGMPAVPMMFEWRYLFSRATYESVGHGADGLTAVSPPTRTAPVLLAAIVLTAMPAVGGRPKLARAMSFPRVE